MFEYIDGRLVTKTPTYLVLEVNGIGYHLEIPLSTYQTVKDRQSARLYTYLKSSEDGITLYGFATLEERHVFASLIQAVSQLGPSKALIILSQIPVGELVQAIEDQDITLLRKIKGIGEKLAQRLIVELRGKLIEVTKGIPSGLRPPSLMHDAIQALVSLGYLRNQAQEAVNKAQRTCSKETSLEDLIRKSLQYIS
jgi:Holliday junction DNA helicase RuvA